MCVGVYRALHIAVVKGEEGLVYRLIHLLTLAHKDLDTYNNLRQVRDTCIIHTHTMYTQHNVHTTHRHT